MANDVEGEGAKRSREWSLSGAEVTILFLQIFSTLAALKMLKKYFFWTLLYKIMIKTSGTQGKLNII